MSVTIHVGDCREVLRTMADQSVHCVVTSPPYFGLRDYGVGGQIGLESSPDAFVAQMVAVFREVRRVLRDDGTLWLNLGDSYCTGTTAKRGATTTGGNHVPASWSNRNQDVRVGTPAGLKTKDLLGIPWRVAFALQADGWYLRQDIIWSKPNPMPESVRDRCTKAHEYLFLLSKSERYYFDQEAIAERATGQLPGNVTPQRIPGEREVQNANLRNGLHTYAERQRSRRNSFARETKQTAGEHGQKPQHRPGREDVDYCGRRNKRSVWTVATQPFKEAHFATFPVALIEPCILAGCPAGGVVLDPFGGAGTTAVAAEQLGRDSVLVELKPDYAEIARRRIAVVQPGLPLVGAA